MNPLFRLLSFAWIAVLAAGLAFVAHTARIHLERAEQLSNLAGGDALAADPNSPSGYAAGVRKLVLPELNHGAHQWILQTQQTLAKPVWRLRHLDTDNAPAGREILSPSPFRWWLARLAQLDHEFSPRNPGQSVERVALLSGALLQAILLLTATPYIAWRFGGLAAAIAAAGITLGFPFAGNFLTPLPGDRALAQVLAVWTLLPLLAAIGGKRRSRGAAGFAVAALAGAALLWVDAGSALLLLGGITAGGIVAAWISRPRVSEPSARARSKHTPDDLAIPEAAAPLPPWRLWSWLGALATILAWLIEYAPDHLHSWRLDFVHPLHALAWLGAGELLHRASARLLGGAKPTLSAWLACGLATAALLALPVVANVFPGFGLLGPEARATRIALLPGTPETANFVAWLRQAAPSAWAAALLPLALLVVAGFRIRRGADEPRLRAAVAIALGAVGLALPVALARVGYWSATGAGLLALAIVLTARSPKRGLFGAAAWVIATLCAVGPSLDLLAVKSPDPAAALSESQFDALLQRDLAHWIAARVPEGTATVLAPPETTGALIYFGGVRGLGTPDPENQEGFGGAVRICGSSSTDEAEALTRKRGITHIVLPSWDGFLTEYARLGNNQPEKSLVSLLTQWQPPRWLRPVAYIAPDGGADIQRQLAVFEVTEVQEQVNALARLADYFLAISQPETAAAVGQALEQHFPQETDSLVARVQVAVARNDSAGFGRLMRELAPVLERGDDADLPWDRRVALALTLAQARQVALAKPRVERALADLDEDRLRQLTTATLYHLHVLGKAFGVQIPDADLRAKARARLPQPLQAQL